MCITPALKLDLMLISRRELYIAPPGLSSIGRGLGDLARFGRGLVSACDLLEPVARGALISGRGGTGGLAGVWVRSPGRAHSPPGRRHTGPRALVAPRLRLRHPRQAAYSSTAAAALTLSDSIRPRSGIATSASQLDATRGRNPRPSAPSTITALSP